MALSMDAEYKGLAVRAAYFRINQFSGSKERVWFSVGMFTTPDGAMLAETNYVMPYDLEADNPIKQGYLYLKTLAEFTGATDC